MVPLPWHRCRGIAAEGIATVASLPWALPPQRHRRGIAAMFMVDVGIAAVGTSVGIATVASLPWDVAAVEVTSVAIAAVALPPCLRPRAVALLLWALPPLAWPLQTLLLWMSPPRHHCHGCCYRGNATSGTPAVYITIVGLFPCAVPPWASPPWHCRSGTATVSFAAVSITALASPLQPMGIAAMTSLLRAPGARALGTAGGSRPP